MFEFQHEFKPCGNVNSGTDDAGFHLLSEWVIVSLQVIMISFLRGARVPNGIDVTIFIFMRVEQVSQICSAAVVVSYKEAAGVRF